MAQNKRATSIAELDALARSPPTKIAIAIWLAACEETNPYCPPLYSVPSSCLCRLTSSASSILWEGRNLAAVGLRTRAEIMSARPIATTIPSKMIKREFLWVNFFQSKISKITYSGVQNFTILTFHITTSRKLDSPGFTDPPANPLIALKSDSSISKNQSITLAYSCLLVDAFNKIGIFCLNRLSLKLECWCEFTAFD